ncbi:MAG: ECF transporter S component [Oscillibacter sp.]|nr:ECF transporter S component [Oscillibacter sp.]
MEKTMERVPAQNPARLLVMTALFAALGCVATMVIQIPSPTGGYMNLGDAAVILGAFLLGPVYGAVAGGLGPAMADLLSGYAVYVPATLIIKAVMAVVAAGLFRALGKKGWSLPFCAVAAEVPMVVGYWLFDALLTFLSSQGSAFTLCLAGSAAGIPSNLVQAIFGAASSTLLAAALLRSAYVRQSFPQFH